MISRMASRQRSHRILRLDTVGSTNTVARELAERGEPEGLVVTAEEQTAGRGRMGRQWRVPRGTSLQLSLLLRPPLAPEHAPRLTIMAGLAVARTLERAYGLGCALKWPNDVLLNGKKVAGILSEASMQGDALAFVILGIGVNLNYAMNEFPEFVPFATTVQDALGHPVDRTELETGLLDELTAYYDRVRAGDSLRGEYRARLEMLGRDIRVAVGGEILQGVARDVDDDGSLLLEQGDAMVKLMAGDVTILKEGI
jgi:BirA family biotin operon repressor/biotin-[acetyl-CoA-carboxylase] ligase